MNFIAEILGYFVLVAGGCLLALGMIHYLAVWIFNLPMFKKKVLWMLNTGMKEYLAARKRGEKVPE